MLELASMFVDKHLHVFFLSFFLFFNFFFIFFYTETFVNLIQVIVPVKFISSKRL